jgi:hypothetical protein
MIALLTFFQISMGLMLAALVRRRMGQVLVLVGQLFVSLLLIGIVVSLSVYWINGELPYVYRSTPFNVLMIGLVVAISRLFLAIAAARLSPYSENRSTPIKVALMQWQIAWIAVFAYVGLVGEDVWFLKVGNNVAIAAWSIAGAVFLGESPLLSPRVRRALPSSILGRVVLGWLQPGPLTGMGFCAVGLIASSLTFCIGVQLVDQNHLIPVANMSILNTGYALFSWGLVAWLVHPLRGQVREGAVISVSIFILLAFMASFIPYAVGGVIHWGKSVPYDIWQVTNWVYAFHEYSAGRTESTIPTIVGVAGLVVFCTALPFAGRAIRMPALMIPERILRDQRELSPNDP